MHILTENDNFLLRFEESVKQCWDKPAVSDFRKSCTTYGEFAKEIETNVLLWKAAGLKPGRAAPTGRRYSSPTRRAASYPCRFSPGSRLPTPKTS